MGFQKGFTPFVKFFKLPKSNQEVFGVLFVKLSSHKKVSAGVGRVAPQIIFAQCSEKGLRPFSCLR